MPAPNEPLRSVRPANAAGTDRPPDTNPALQPPAVATPTVPGYEIERELGRGGMGVVYLARHARLNRTVALKMVLAAGRQALARFLNEAQAAAAIDHPHVVRVYEYGEHAGQPFLALEYVSGGNLADLLETRELSDPVEAAALVARAAAGVQAAHTRGIIHRDLKPANVLLTEEGVPKVADFGLAKSSDGANLTQPGAVMGTLEYMAPEQAAGRPVTTAADVYALGAILFRCLTGRVPIESDGSHPVLFLKKVVEQKPPSVRSLAPGVPRELERVIGRCLQKNPTARYKTAGEMAAHLERFLATKPVPTPPSRLAAYRFTLLAVSLTAVAGGAVWLWQQADRNRPDIAAALARLVEEKQQAETARDQAFRARDEAAKAKDLAEALRVNAEAALDLAVKGRDQLAEEKRRAEKARDDEVRAREQAEKARDAADKRRVEAEMARNALAMELKKTAAVEPERKWAEFPIFRGHRDIVFSASFSPDGRRVVTASWDKTARVWDADTGKELLALTAHTDAVVSASFSPDGRRVVTASWDKTAREWDADTGKVLLALMGHSDSVNSVSFNPDGRRVVTTSKDNSARVWDADIGKELLALTGHTNSVNSASFSPGGRRLVTASNEHSARVWDANTGKEHLALTGHTNSLTSALFSPDGRRLVTASWDKTARVWDAETGKELLALTGHTDSVRSASFSLDGQRVVTASSDNLARVWDANTGKELLALRGHTDSVRSASFSPDGRRVVTASWDKTARVWDVSSTARK